jgi:hypothetical protein
MSKCQDCGKEMKTAYGCDPKKGYIVFKTKMYKRNLCNERESHHGRCHDCGAKSGYLHHNGCDMESCPKCGGQLLSCDCGGNEPSYIGSKKELEKYILTLKKTKPKLKPSRFKGIL